MRKVGFFSLLFLSYCFTAYAQEIDDVNGKTYYYYDSTTKKKVKEIFHHIQEFRVSYDNKGNSRDTVMYIKNGPYTRYHENGSLYCSGYYQKSEKSGTWKYYNQTGKLIRTEEWASGKIVKSVSH